jgi:hypothetical protein
MTRVTSLGCSAAVLIVLAGMSLAACGSGSPGPAGTASAPASPSPSWSGSPLSEADADAVSAVVRSYWAAYNAYDADGAIAYLAPAYRPEKAEVVRSEVGRIKTFGVQLGVREKASPEAVGPDEAQVYLSMKTPTGLRTVLMKLRYEGGEWQITYAEEVK